jgi:hypothetical protein
MRFYAGGLEAERGTVTGAARAALAGARGELTAAEAFALTVAARRSGASAVPGAAIAATVASARSAVAAGTVPGLAGNSYTYNMPVQGALPVDTPGSVVAQMRRINEVGELPPKLLSPTYSRRKRKALG